MVAQRSGGSAGRRRRRSVLLLLLLWGGVFLRPLASGFDGGLFVFFPGFGDFGGERVVGVGGAEEGLNGEEDGTDLKGRRPVIYEKIERERVSRGRRE